MAIGDTSSCLDGSKLEDSRISHWTALTSFFQAACRLRIDLELHLALIESHHPENGSETPLGRTENVSTAWDSPPRR